MKGLQGKNALVTGASSGIGQAIAVRLAQEGVNVAIHYNRGADGAKETQQQIEAAGSSAKLMLVQADVSQEDAIDGMFDKVFGEFQGLDFLINNAGFQIPGASHEMPPEDFRKVIDTNLTGAYLCARRTIAHLRSAEKPGVVINVSSVHEIVPKPTYIGYSVSKGGMGNLTRTLALEYAPHGIRVNGLGPGATVTPINAAWIDDPKKRADVESHIPMGRAGTSEEMAGVTAFLLSDEAAYITGQTIYVDGGLTLYPEFRVNWSS